MDKKEEEVILSTCQQQLMSCLKEKKNKKAMELIKNGCDPNFTTNDILSYSPLYVAALRDDVDMVRFLVEECMVFVNKDMAAFFTINGNFSVGHYLAKKLKVTM